MKDPNLTDNQLHRSDMGVVGDLEHGGRRISIARVSRAESLTYLQWNVDGVYASGSPAKAAAVLDAWLQSLPAGARMTMNSEAIDVAVAIREIGQEPA